jgi:flagellar basal-body rod protein FlgB
VIPSVENSTTTLLSLALDAAVMRQQAIAHNIANAGTQGYQRLGVSFEAQFAALAGTSLADDAAQLRAHLRPAVVAVGRPGDTVEIDLEVSALSETVVHHHALVKALGKHLALVALAVNEGKR